MSPEDAAKLDGILRGALLAQPEARPMMHTLAEALEAMLEDADAAKAALAALVASAKGFDVDENVAKPTLDNERFELAGLLTHTGRCALWLARDTQRDVDVLVKILHPHLASDADEVSHFIEVVSPSFDGTPTAVTTGWVEQDGSGAERQPYAVLEYTEGVDLGQLLKSHGALDPQVAVYIAARVARTLSDCHALILDGGAHGLLHGSIKPGHVLLAEDGSVAILDFGGGVDTSNAKKKARARESYTWPGSSASASAPNTRVLERDTPEEPKKQGFFGKLATMIRGESKTEDAPEEKDSGRRDFWK